MLKESIEVFSDKFFGYFASYDTMIDISTLKIMF